MADATLRLVTDSQLLAETRQRAYQYAKPMFWPNVGRKYLELFTEVADGRCSDSSEVIRMGSPLSVQSRLFT